LSPRCLTSRSSLLEPSPNHAPRSTDNLDSSSSTCMSRRWYELRSRSTPTVGVMVCVRGGTRTRVRGNPAAGRCSCVGPSQCAAQRASDVGCRTTVRAAVPSPPTQVGPGSSCRGEPRQRREPSRVGRAAQRGRRPRFSPPARRTRPARRMAACAGETSGGREAAHRCCAGRDGTARAVPRAGAIAGIVGFVAPHERLDGSRRRSGPSAEGRRARPSTCGPDRCLMARALAGEWRSLSRPAASPSTT